MSDFIKRDDVIIAIKSFAKEKINEGKYKLDTVDTAVELILKIKKLKG